VATVIDPDTEHFARIWNQREEPDFIEPAVRFGASRKLQHLVNDTAILERFA
jgi:hypothetical protein